MGIYLALKNQWFWTFGTGSGWNVPELVCALDGIMVNSVISPNKLVSKIDVPAKSLKLRTSDHCFSELSDRFHGFPPIRPKEMPTVMIGHLLPWTR